MVSRSEILNTVCDESRATGSWFEITDTDGGRWDYNRWCGGAVRNSRYTYGLPNPNFTQKQWIADKYGIPYVNMMIDETVIQAQIQAEAIKKEQEQLQAQLNMLSSPTAQWVNQTTFLNESEAVYNKISSEPVVKTPPSIITPTNPTIKPPITIDLTEQLNPILEQLKKVQNDVYNQKIQENAGLQKASVFDNPILLIAIAGIVLFLVLRR